MDEMYNDEIEVIGIYIAPYCEPSDYSPWSYVETNNKFLQVRVTPFCAMNIIAKPLSNCILLPATQILVSFW